MPLGAAKRSLANGLNNLTLSASRAAKRGRGRPMVYPSEEES
jgi:hypothetical protein